MGEAIISRRTGSSRLFLSNTLIKVNKISSINGTRATSDDDFLYIGGHLTKIRKIRKSDMSLVAESALDYKVGAICADVDYIYIGERDAPGPYRVVKLNKSNLSVVSVSGTFNYDILSIDVDSSYVYIGMSNSVDYGRKVFKINKSTLSTVATSEIFKGGITNLISKDNYLYIIDGNDSSIIKRLKKSNLAVDILSNDGGDVYGIYTMCIDENFVFVSKTSKRILKFKLSDLSFVNTSSVASSYAHSLVTDEKNIYAWYSDKKMVLRFDKISMEKNGQSEIIEESALRLSTGKQRLYTIGNDVCEIATKIFYK